MSSQADNMYNFFLKVFEAVPDFLMSEPICYIFGIVMGFFVVGLLYKLCHLAD